ncbi:MAG: alpha/beta hydrolase [Candidatus Woesearchaeota archaeon]
MERVIFKNSRNQSLVGHLYTSASKSIIIISHAMANDKSERGKLDRVAKELNQSEYNVLVFDFSGCGESDDDTLTVEKEVDDLKSAIHFSKSRGYTKIGLFGHSLGCLVSLKCYTPDIHTMVLWSPITDKVKYTWDERLSKEQLHELEHKGYFTRTRKNAIRTTYQVDKQMLIDREIVDQKDLLKNVTCPILLIHGTKDTTVPITDSEEAITLLSQDSKLELVDGADHDFNEHVDSIVRLSTDWFLSHLER